MDTSRLRRLQNSAAEGDVAALFSIVAEDPYVLERIDEIPFVTTPLHTAISEGNIHFAKEVVNLKPTLASKRDHLGRSPLHLALEAKKLQEGRSPRDLDLEEKYQELITWLIEIHPELVRVKAKGMVTPLHYAAQIDDEFNLADFLYVCPSSIKDLTVKCETAVHVALKNRSIEAFKVLLGWLRHFDQEEVLIWEDEDGNNALHTAISENQPQAVKLLIRYMNVNRKNGKGLRALDIFYDRQQSLNSEIGQILLGAKARRASEVIRCRCNVGKSVEKLLIKTFFGYKKSLVDYLCGELVLTEVIMKHVRLGDRIINRIPLEAQNVILVVAILTATATYQAALSPPGGLWQDDGDEATNNKTTATSNTTNTTHSSKNFPGSLTNLIFKARSEQIAGHMVLGSLYHLNFMLFNTVAFSTSVCTIIIVTIGLRFSQIIGLSTTLIVIAYCFALTETSPFPFGSVLWYLFCILVTLIGGAAYFIPLVLFLRERLLKFYGRGKLRLGSLEQPKM
ncbi:ankyrin repeat-containing protein BDA1-like [Pistacia vera]|uniref:ankyrin repeat-containing protein BDA1-like n=1 Tax=Pistacia vera TaxID=55513 RepID=UPI0012633E67|nr:ankyrin repeat-containing protein BDA1-like [Pistacia vera]